MRFKTKVPPPGAVPFLGLERRASKDEEWIGFWMYHLDAGDNSGEPPVEDVCLMKLRGSMLANDEVVELWKQLEHALAATVSGICNAAGMTYDATPRGEA